MLTRGLEEWIQKGKAEFKTFVFGGSGVGTIPVAANKFIIICDFVYFPFIDFDNPVNSDNIIEHSTYQLQFRSRKSTNHFIIRNGALVGKDSPVFMFSLLGSMKFDTYLVEEGDVQIDIVRVPPVSGWTTNYSPLPSKSNEAPQPVGYGIGGQPAVREIDFSPTETYLPLTHLRDDLLSNFYREQFKVNVNAANKLNDIVPGNQVENYGYPIVNVSYVEFNMNLNQFVQASN